MMQQPTRTYGDLAFASTGYWFVTGLPPHVSLRFKSFFPQVRKETTKDFTLKDTPRIGSDLLWFMSRFPLRVTAQDLDRLNAGHRQALELVAQAEQIMSGSLVDAPIAGFRAGRAPYPFQDQAASLAVLLGRLLVLDDIGLGKTITALAAVLRAKLFPVAIVVQAHLADQWLEEYIQPFTTLTAHIIKGTKPYELPPADVYIFKYSNIAGWVDTAGTGVFRAVVLDEIQEVRHGAKTAKGIAASVFLRQAELKIGLTATPIYNYGPEIFNITEAVQPGILGSYDEFLTEWCTQSRNHDIVRDPPALGSYLRDEQIIVRRTEADVDKQLLPLNTLVHNIPFDHDVMASVQAEARVLALKVINGSFTERGQAARELDMRLRHATGVAKARGVAALVRMLVKTQGRVLLGGWHRDVYDIWLDVLSDLDPVMYTGTESAAQKRKTKKAFIAGDAQVMVMSLRSGAGVDGLQDVCHTAIAGELDWSPQVIRQFFGRVRRPGQQHVVDGIYAITNGGSDPALVEMLGLKSSQAHGIVDPFAGPMLAPVSDDSRMRKLAQAYLDGATT